MLPEELKAQKFVDMGGENILDFLGLNRGHGALNGAKCQKSIWKEGNQWKWMEKKKKWSLMNISSIPLFGSWIGKNGMAMRECSFHFIP